MVVCGRSAGMWSKRPFGLSGPTELLGKLQVLHIGRIVMIRAADFSVKSAQAPRPYRQALIKTIIMEGTRPSGGRP